MLDWNNISNVVRDGTSQTSRNIPSLDPEYIKIDERSNSDIIRFTRELASIIPFYDLDHQIQGTWEGFFSSTDQTDPHFALFKSFLQCLQYARDDLNGLTYEHLTYYYQRVLRLNQKAAISDHVPVIFQLAKNFDRHLIPKGTLLKVSGKDSLGKELQYETEKDLVVNKAQISQLKSVFVEEILSESEKEQNKEKKGKTTPGKKEVETKANQLFASFKSNTIDGLDQELDDPAKGWNPFGESQIVKDQSTRSMQEGTVGLAISSPILLLGEGERIITFSFQLRNKISLNIEDVQGKLEASFSGEEGWIGPYELENIKITDSLLQFDVSISESQPAVIPYLEDQFSELYHTSAPVVKFLVKKEPNKLLSEFATAIWDKINISIKVSKVRNLILQNDQTVMDPGKPVQPFGSNPIVGSSFYVGSNEVFRKPLDKLDIELEWMDLPEDVGTHYSEYTGSLSKDDFKAIVSVLSKKKWDKKTDADAISIFRSDENSKKKKESSKKGHEKSKQIEIHGVEGITRKRLLDGSQNLFDPPVPVSFNDPNLTKYDTNTLGGFVRLQLIETNSNLKAFGHAEYPMIYAQRIMQKKDQNLPNVPYTPTLKSVSINYESSTSVSFQKYSREIGFYHIEPFGIRRLTDNGLTSILPQFDREGYFFMGIKDLEPPQNFTVLFQTVDGSAEPLDTSLEWSYLSKNKWIPLRSRVLSDSTLSLQISGIIEFQVPNDATKNDTLMPDDLYWIRGEADQVQGISRIVDIHSQATMARFLDQDNAPDHLYSALEPNRITKLAISQPAIKSISQPYASFGGKVAEVSKDYYTRVSERLRHKGRAINAWDYERLVLERFPSIYKVKCLNHTDSNSEFAPGHVTLVVVPNVKKRKAVDFFAPKVSLQTISEIKEYIEQFISPSVELDVINPNYQEVRVEFRVAFREGKDEGYYTQKLNEDIRRFLTPWTFDDGKDIVFGGKIYKSAILEFIEKQPYVDFITGFKFYHENEGIGDMMVTLGPGILTKEEEFTVKSDIEIAEPANSRSVLISAQNHNIIVIRSSEEECLGTDGINDMVVELDMVVRNENINSL